jgi:hypothetical protein
MSHPPPHSPTINIISFYNWLRKRRLTESLYKALCYQPIIGQFIWKSFEVFSFSLTPFSLDHSWCLYEHPDAISRS